MRSTRRGSRDIASGLASRRRVLGDALGLGLSGVAIGLLSACDPSEPASDDPDARAPGTDPSATPTPEPDPDLALLEAAVAIERELLDFYDATLMAHTPLADLIKPAAANHREHLRYLNALVASAAQEPLPEPLPDPTGTEADRPTESTAGPTTGPPESVPESVGDALAALSAVEDEAATTHLGDVKAAVGGQVARLFASLSACAQSHVFRFELYGDAYVS